jgi:glycosyltransferase involved in cell wall biosynthesis
MTLLPRIYVVTPYYKEDLSVLARCHASVAGQEVDAHVVHVMVADGFPASELATWDIAHVILPDAHADNGNTPRHVGALTARSRGADFIAFLDADNWYLPGHLAAMLRLHAAENCEVTCSWRNFYDENEALLPVEEADEINCDHVDTSCIMMHKAAFAANSIWTDMPRQLSPICDRVFYAGLRRRRYRIGYTREKSVAFTTTYASHYDAVGRQAPMNDKHDAVQRAQSFALSLEGAGEIMNGLGFWIF